ncbi:MAG TPA: hypothetical protein VMV34_04195 [Terriglobia bacterium]|nr:hypothetical protein [Terriglobia bacterium]
MSRPEKRYQKYLARKRRKQREKRSQSAQGGVSAPQITLASHFPVHEAVVPANLFEQGIGNLVFSRSLPNGRLALSAFLLDVFCLGVKNAFAAVVTRDEYARRLSRWPAGAGFQPIEPACFRKLVEGGVAYARNLGFSPHADYAVASQIFGNGEATACPTRFEYGQGGKPYYISGPHETPAQGQAIVEQLERRLGAGNFDYLVLGH